MKATRTYVEAIAKTLSEHDNITFKEGKGWSTDIQKKIVTYDPQSLIDYDIDAVKGLLIHETGHVNFTTANKPTPEQVKHPSIQQAYNMLEDMRIEKEQVKRYKDFARVPLTTINAIGLLGKAEDTENLKKAPKLMQYLHGLQAVLLPYADYHIEDMLPYKEVAKIQDKINQTIGPELTEKINNTLNNCGTGNLVDMILNATSTDEVKDITHKYILPYCEDLLEEADKKPEKELQGLEPKDGHGRGMTEKGLNKQMTIPQDNELDLLLNPYVNTLAQKLSDILKEKAQTRFVGSHRSGKLLSRNAYKVLTSETRIFSRKNTPDKPKYTITMILDESGSMKDGIKQQHTYIGAYLLDKTCKKLGFKVNLIGMDSTARELNTIADYREIRGHGNEEIRALKLAKSKISKDDDNIIFLLTDGLTCSKPKPLIKELTDKLNSTVIAVGIGLDQNDINTMKQEYPISIQAQEPEKLADTLIGAMQRLITR